MIRVRDIMSDVVEVLEVGDNLALAARRMRAGHLRHLPVVDGQQQLVGLLTHRKLVSAWVSHGDPEHERPADVARDVPVEMVMEREVLTTWPDAPALTVARLMEDHKYGCVPVLDDGKLIGIVTETDFVKLARSFLERQEALEAAA